MRLHENKITKRTNCSVCGPRSKERTAADVLIPELQNLTSFQNRIWDNRPEQARTVNHTYDEDYYEEEDYDYDEDYTEDSGSDGLKVPFQNENHRRPG